MFKINLGIVVFFVFALLSANIEFVNAQNVKPLAPPPEHLAPTSGISVSPTEQTFEEFDPFVAETPDNSGLNFFDTRNVPFASWASEGTWPEDVINSVTINRFRKAFYQRTAISGGWVANQEDSGLGQSYFNSSINLTVGRPQNLVILSPSFNIHFLDGPDTIDVPDKVYGAFANILWRWQWSENWGSMIAVRPGLFSDFESSDAQGSRFGGFAAISWRVIPEQLTVFGGVVYLDRNDINFVPALGLTWTPTCDLRFDLLFPKPKISKRVGHIPYVSEDWIYVAGSLGGGTFEVQRAAGGFDELTIRDYRLSLGIERIVEGGTGWFAEVGWVFGRRLEYEISGEELRYDDSFGIEAGFSF